MCLLSFLSRIDLDGYINCDIHTHDLANRETYPQFSVFNRISPQVLR